MSQESHLSTKKLKPLNSKSKSHPIHSLRTENNLKSFSGNYLKRQNKLKEEMWSTKKKKKGFPKCGNKGYK